MKRGSFLKEGQIKVQCKKNMTNLTRENNEGKADLRGIRGGGVAQWEGPARTKGRPKA